MRKFAEHIYAGSMYEDFEGIKIDLRHMPDRFNDIWSQKRRIDSYHQMAETYLSEGHDVAFCCAQGKSRSAVVAALWVLYHGGTPPEIDPSPGLRDIYSILTVMHKGGEPVEEES